MNDWSSLPYDIIHKVTTYIDSIEDFLSYSAVCSSWRSVYLTKQWHPGPQIPLLMLSDCKNSSHVNFFSLYRNKICSTVLRHASESRCWGTSTDWLLTVGSDLQMHLLNACTRVCLSLPSAYSLGMHFGEVVGWYHIICKSIVIKSIPENDENWLVLVIYGPFKHMAFCRPGYRSWIGVKDRFWERFLDVVCVRNQIFAICDSGALVAVEIDGPNVPTLVDVTLPNRLWAWRRVLLVESCGDLWMVCPFRAGNKQSTVRSRKFVVYSYDFSERQWLTLSDLGNCSIFLGDTCAICIEAPDSLNCKSNHIYFIVNKLDPTGTCRKGHMDYALGVFNMNELNSEPLRVGPSIAEHYCCPLWLMPTLY